MYQIYILKSLKDYRTYVGYSEDAYERIKEHNAGRVRATEKRRPLEIIYIENVESIKYAKQREVYWKSGAGRRRLRQYFEKGFPPIEDGRGSSK